MIRTIVLACPMPQPVDERAAGIALAQQGAAQIRAAFSGDPAAFGEAALEAAERICGTIERIVIGEQVLLEWIDDNGRPWTPGDVASLRRGVRRGLRRSKGWRRHVRRVKAQERRGR